MLVVAGLVAVAAANVARNTPGAACTVGTDPDDQGLYYPHPTVCSQYLKCDGGVLTVQDCPPFLHWNATVSACDWPNLAGCDPNAGPVPMPPGSEEENLGSPPGSEIPGVVGGTCSVGEDEGHGLYFPHPGFCTHYLACDNGILIERECPNGLHWYAAEQTCNWPEVANCHLHRKA